MTFIKKLISMVMFMSCFSSLIYSQDEIGTNSKLKGTAIEKMVAQIDSKVDTSFVYDYEKTRFVPPVGKTLLIMGQTVERIKEYQSYFSDEPIPGGWAAYWGIPEFKGITGPFKNNTSSTQNHQMLVDEFPNTVIHSAMWMVGTWDVAKNTAKGKYDHVIKKYGEWAKSINRPIYLRIGYEFDGQHNAMEPKQYVKAYQRIVDRLRKQGVTNIAYVWHSYASKPYKDYKVSAWYPGDDYVDWVGISVFGHAYNGSDFGKYCDYVLEWAKQHKKPVMIAESNPIHGIDTENSDVWQQWFVNFFNFIYAKNIKAISFINEDWESLTIDGLPEWKDGRLYNNEKVSKAWFMETNKDRYLKQSPELFREIGFDE